MTKVESGVASCFASVFPNLAGSDLRRASQASLAEWDSVAHVTLLAAISEEFEFLLDDDAFEQLTSYLLIVDFVERSLA